MNQSVNIPASALPIYDRAVKRFPHLVHVKDAFHFCQLLCILAAVPGVSIRDYFKIAKVAHGETWEED